MTRKHFLAFMGGLVAAVLLAVGSSIFTPIAAQSDGAILVGAAASLQNVLEAIDPLFERANPGVQVNYSFAASGPLQQQIEQGAPIDVFVSAAARQMDALQQGGRILTETRRNLLTNRLVLIVPRSSRLGLNSFRQLTGANVRRIAIGEPRSVPAGQYAQELLGNLGILEQVRSKFVYGNSVRNVLAAVESGNADAGIVYTTDARISDRLTQVATAPENLHSRIVYPIAVLRDSRNPQAARAYAQFLTGTQARAVFVRAGFGLAP